MALINLNDTTPAAPSGYQNAKWQADSSSPRNVSAYIPGAGGVLVKTADYTAVAADCGKLIVFNSLSPHTLTLPAAAPFAQWNIAVQNIGSGGVTISPNGLNIDGAGSGVTLAQAQGLAISTDATNYFTERGAVNVAPSIGGVAPKTGDYTAVTGDSGKLLIMNSGSAHSITLPSVPPSPTWMIAIQNVGAGTLTVSRGGLTIDTASSDLALITGQGTLIWCDGSNYFTERGMASASASLGGVSVKTADYTAVAGDSGKLLVMNTGSAQTITLPLSPPSSTWVIAIQNAGAGTLTVSRGGLTIDTAASDLSVTTGQGTLIWCDGSNYFTERGLGSPPTLTTKGDLLAYSTVLARQPVGANGSCLQADSTQSTGIRWLLQPYDVTFAYPGAPPNATLLQLICFSRAVAMQGNFAGSTGHCGGNPTSTAVYTVYKNASPIGTVTIATSGGFTFATAGGAAQSFVTGDTLSISAPTADATLSSVTMTFAGTR
jgi:hypothetical protein